QKVAGAGGIQTLATSAACGMRRYGSVTKCPSAPRGFLEPEFPEGFLRECALQELDELARGRTRLRGHRDWVDDRRVRVGGEEIDDPHTLLDLRVGLVNDAQRRLAACNEGEGGAHVVCAHELVRDV